MMRNLLVAAIGMGVLAIASTPVSYRSTMKLRIEMESVGNPYERGDRISLTTMYEMLYTSELGKIIKDSAVRFEEEKGIEFPLLLSEKQTPEEAEKSVERALQVTQKYIPVVRASKLHTQPVFPWWRPIAALGLLALFSLLMPFGRRESLL